MQWRVPINLFCQKCALNYSEGFINVCRSVCISLGGQIADVPCGNCPKKYSNTGYRTDAIKQIAFEIKTAIKSNCLLLKRLGITHIGRVHRSIIIVR